MISSKWFIDNPDREKRIEHVRHSRELLGIMAQIARNEISSLESTPFEDYSVPGWELREADRKGQIRSWRHVLSLCDLNQKGQS